MSSNEQLGREIACLREQVESLAARDHRRREPAASWTSGLVGAAIGAAFGVVSTLAIGALATTEIFVQYAPITGARETALRTDDATLSTAAPLEVLAFVPATPRMARAVTQPSQPSGPATPMTAMTSPLAIALSPSSGPQIPTMPAPDLASVLSAAGMTGTLSPEAIIQALSGLEAH